MSRFADDLVASQSPWWTQTQEDYLRAIATMFAQAEDYASDPDDPDGATPYVLMPNQAPNPSFERDSVGGFPAGWVIVGSSLASWAVANNWAGSGVHSFRLVTNALTSTQTALVLTNGPDLGPGAASTSYGWNVSRLATNQVAGRFAYRVNSLSGQFWAYMQVLCCDATGAVISTPTTRSGLLVAGVGSNSGLVTLPPGTVWFMVALTLECNAAGTLDINLDNVGLYLDPAGVVPPYNDGDSPGWQWGGTPGNSMSYAVPPYPQVGWSKMWDVDRADTAGLPWLAQIVGERIPAGMADAQVRQLIRRNPNAYRGTVSAIAHGIMPMLTGTQSVFTRERAKLDGTTPNGWLAVQTYATETPSVALVQQQLRQKLVPASVLLDYGTLSRNTWTTVQAGSPTWTTVEAGPKTWTAIETVLGFPAGYTLWTPS